MKKTAVALVAAASCIVGGVSVPQVAESQTMNYADVYQPNYGVTYNAGVVPTDEFLFLGGDEAIASVTFEFGASPYPATITPYPNSTSARLTKIYVSLMPERIYPTEFSVPVSSMVTYTDGSSERVDGFYRIKPTAALVADGVTTTASAPTMATTTVTKTTTATATVTETAEPTATTVTKTQAPVTTTTTVTAPPTTVTKEPAPATVTTTATTTVTTTVKAAPVTTTVSGAPVTATTTVTPETTTVTKTVEPKPSQGQDSGSSSGGVWAAVLAILAAIGGGAYWWYFNMR